MRLYKSKVLFLAGSLLFFTACERGTSSRIAELLQNQRAGVFLFLAPDCPLSQNYTLTLNQLQTRFQPNSVAFYGVFSGLASNKKDINDFVRTYKVGFPVIPDPDSSLADVFGATQTPEAFAVGPDGIPFYKGAIDDWAPELGRHRLAATEHYLRDALDSFLQHRAIAIRETNAVGCFIERGG